MCCPKTKCQMLLCVLGFFLIDMQNTVKTELYFIIIIIVFSLLFWLWDSSRSCLWTSCFYLSVKCCFFRDFIPLHWVMCTCVFCMAASRLAQVTPLYWWGITWGVYPAFLLSREDNFLAHGSQPLPLSSYKLLSLLVRQGTNLAGFQVWLFSGWNDVPIIKFWTSDVKLTPLLSQLWL